MRATIIAIEGPDRVGKATQSQMLVDNLQKQGFKATRVEVPIKGPVTYTLIYWMLRNGLAKSLPNTFQFVQFLNKFFFQVFKLLFIRWVYDYIVFDRWAASAIVYGNAGGANPGINKFLYNRLWKPDATIILQGLPRTDDQEDVYEKDNVFQAAVRFGYGEFFMQNPRDCRVVDNTGTREEVHSKIMNLLDSWFDVL